MRAFLVAVAVLLPAVVHGQSAACHDAQVVLVGRAEPAVTFHISGEAAIGRARQNLQRIEAEVARERTAPDPHTRLERDVELETRIVRAFDELDNLEAMYPPPYDLTFIPFLVEDGIRGVTESTVMLLDRHLPMPLEPGQSYLIVGHRAEGLVPPLPAMAHLDHLNSAIEAIRVIPATSAQQEVAFLAATRSGATLLGTLRRHSWGGGLAPPIPGARVVLSSSGQVIETLTKEDGSFAVFGIPPGRIALTPILPEDLIVFDKAASTINVREGACRQVTLTAEVNGRVRGRVISASGRSIIKGVTLVLSGVDEQQFRLNPSVHRVNSHAPRLQVTAAEDGAFEFVGVPAGTYLLIARTPGLVNGRQTTLTTLYPGTHEQAAAMPITVGHATEHDGFDFVVRME